MHVRYLQHPQHGTVQLLTTTPTPTATASMPSTVNIHPLAAQFTITDGEESAGDGDASSSASTSGTASGTAMGGGAGECESVPLPIQMFLWRQSNPFLGARNEKLHDSACISFERVVVQNIVHGLSPSLSDAIASISRWRFVRAAFPHVVQCCGSLLAERASELQSSSSDESLQPPPASSATDPSQQRPMSSALVKTLYILHWLLMDAAGECNEGAATAGGGEEGESVRNFAYPVSSIQLFVYLLAPLFGALKENDIDRQIRLESGLRLWLALWECRLPTGVLCFCAPVKQRRDQLPQILGGTGSKVVSTVVGPSTGVEPGGIYLGETTGVGQGAGGARRASNLPPHMLRQRAVTVSDPPPKPPRSDATVLREIQLRAQVGKMGMGGEFKK